MFKRLANTRGLIGVDVGTRYVKVAQLARRGGEIALERAVVFPRNHGGTFNEGPPVPRTLDGVEDLLRACDDFSGGKSAAVLPMSACEVTSESVETDLPELQLRDIAARLAARDTQLTGRLQHDHWLSPGGNQPTLHVLATQQPLTMRLAQQQQWAGWTCVGVDGLPMALARALRLGGSSTHEPVAVIDWGWSRVTVCVVLRGIPVFVRSFARGALSQFAMPLCEELHLTPQEASEVLACEGLPSASRCQQSSRVGQLAERSTAAARHDFEDEVGRTLQFVAARQRFARPQRILLMGGGATLAHADDYVREKFSLDTALWEMPQSKPQDEQSVRLPIALLGPAIALSALAWEAA